MFEEEEKKLKEITREAYNLCGRNESKLAAEIGLPGKRGKIVAWINDTIAEGQLSDLAKKEIASKSDDFLKRKQEAQEKGVGYGLRLKIPQAEIPEQFETYEDSLESLEFWFKEKDKFVYDKKTDKILNDACHHFRAMKGGYAYFVQYMVWLLHYLIQGNTNLNKNHRMKRIERLLDESINLLNNNEYWEMTRPFGKGSENHDKKFEFLLCVNSSSFIFLYVLSSNPQKEIFEFHAEKAKKLLINALEIGRKFGIWNQADVHRNGLTIANLLKDFGFAKELVEEIKNNRELLTLGIKEDIKDPKELLNLKQQQILNILEDANETLF